MSVVSRHLGTNHLWAFGSSSMVWTVLNRFPAAFPVLTVHPVNGVNSFRDTNGQGRSPRWSGSGLGRRGWGLRRRNQGGFAPDSGGLGLDLAQFEQGPEGLGAFPQGPVRPDRCQKPLQDHFPGSF